jgi:hypothetical protein
MIPTPQHQDRARAFPTSDACRPRPTGVEKIKSYSPTATIIAVVIVNNIDVNFVIK